jgi:hypothetical protein
MDRNEPTFSYTSSYKLQDPDSGRKFRIRIRIQKKISGSGSATLVDTKKEKSRKIYRGCT